ncbi:hypothetical protein [Cognatishimia sp. F0-27]|uniref:hypothetical protein n=1 Tax=Cognatishimia sp. F0-27 TaxID=2816855 RepID=UPI001D0C18E3|nr:hypothetical protein [Cognatishimia sp. F0-27]MCC1494315.1 hypothetical protein [Cognatishimia sp. F0-27]
MAILIEANATGFARASVAMVDRIAAAGVRHSVERSLRLIHQVAPVSVAGMRHTQKRSGPVPTRFRINATHGLARWNAPKGRLSAAT